MSTDRKRKFKQPKAVEGMLNDSSSFIETEKKETLVQEYEQTIIEDEKATLENEQQEAVRTLKLKNDILQAEVNTLNDDNKGRRDFSENIFTLVCLWMFFVLVTLIASGRRFIIVSDNVIITLLTTTTVEVIGLMVIVANYLFKSSNKNSFK